MAPQLMGFGFLNPKYLKSFPRLFHHLHKILIDTPYIIKHQYISLLISLFLYKKKLKVYFTDITKTFKFNNYQKLTEKRSAILEKYIGSFIFILYYCWVDSIGVATKRRRKM